MDPVALEALLQRPLLAAEKATFVPGRFPLIAVALGLYCESRSHSQPWRNIWVGFVVVTVPLVGTNSALVRLDGQDLELRQAISSSRLRGPGNRHSCARIGLGDWGSTWRNGGSDSGDARRER